MLQLEKIGYAVVLSGIVLLAFTCHQSNTPTVAQEAVELQIEADNFTTTAASDISKSSEGTRIALIEPCGRCHQSTLDTHKAGAIAIFDLDKGDKWHMTLKEENLDGLLGRTKSNNAISKKDYTLIEKFVEQKRTTFH